MSITNSFYPTISWNQCPAVVTNTMTSSLARSNEHSHSSPVNDRPIRWLSITAQSAERATWEWCLLQASEMIGLSQDRTLLHHDLTNPTHNGRHQVRNQEFKLQGRVMSTILHLNCGWPVTNKQKWTTTNDEVWMPPQFPPTSRIVGASTDNAYSCLCSDMCKRCSLQHTT